jgi:hypothetical protein
VAEREAVVVLVWKWILRLINAGERPLGPLSPFDLRGFRGGSMITTKRTFISSQMPKMINKVRMRIFKKER